MKAVRILVRPSLVDPVLDALEGIDLPGLTIADVAGWGKVRGDGEPTATVTIAGRWFEPQISIEAIVTDAQAERVIDALAGALGTASATGGKVFVYEVCDAFRLRTGERGADAL